MSGIAMITLTICNSYSRLEGMTPAQEKQVRDALSYDLDKKAAYFSGNFRSTRRCLMDKKGNFPSGLLSRLPPWAMAFTDTRIKPSAPLRPFMSNLYAWQEQAVIVAANLNRGI